MKSGKKRIVTNLILFVFVFCHRWQLRFGSSVYLCDCMGEICHSFLILSGLRVNFFTVSLSYCLALVLWLEICDSKIFVSSLSAVNMIPYILLFERSEMVIVIALV